MKHKIVKLKLWFKGLKRLWAVTSIEHRLDLIEKRFADIELNKYKS